MIHHILNSYGNPIRIIVSFVYMLVDSVKDSVFKNVIQFVWRGFLCFTNYIQVIFVIWSQNRH